MLTRQPPFLFSPSLSFPPPSHDILKYFLHSDTASTRGVEYISFPPICPLSQMIRALLNKVGDVGVPPYLIYTENTLSMKLPPRGSDGNATCSFLNWI